MPLLSFDTLGRAVLPAFPPLVAAAACLAYAFGLNNITDAQLDDSVEKNPLSKRRTTDLAAPKFALAVLVFLVLGISWLLGPFVLMAAVTQILGSTLYSSGPRLKALPIAGTLMNVWIFAPLCLFGGLDPNSIDSFWLFLVTFCFLLLQNQLLHEVDDFEDDFAGDIRTTAVRYGRERALIASSLMGVIAAALIIIIGWRSAHWIPFAVGTVPILVISGWTLRRSAARPPSATGLRLRQRLVAVVCGALIWLIHYHPDILSAASRLLP